MEKLNRFFQDTNQSYFLFGPRGTGKSTWVKQHLKNALYIDLLAPEVFRSYSAKIHPKSVGGLTAFKEDYPEAQTCLLYRGTERIKIKNVLCMPCEEFLLNLYPEKPIKFG